MSGLNPIYLAVMLLLAGGAVGVTAMLSARNRPAFVYGQLVLMAGIYVGFAVIAVDAKDIVLRADWSVLIVETMIALVILLLGLAVMNSARPWLLGVMMLVHGGIDLMHLLMKAAHSPGWYAFLCLLYDAVVGVAAIWLLSQEPSKNPAESSSL